MIKIWKWGRTVFFLRFFPGYSIILVHFAVYTSHPFSSAFALSTDIYCGWKLHEYRSVLFESQKLLYCTRVRMKCFHNTFILYIWHQHLIGSRKVIKWLSHRWSKLRLHMGYVRLKNSKAYWIRQLVSKRKFLWNVQFQRRNFAWSYYLKNHIHGPIYIRTYVLCYVRKYKRTLVNFDRGHPVVLILTVVYRYIYIYIYYYGLTQHPI